MTRVSQSWGFRGRILGGSSVDEEGRGERRTTRWWENSCCDGNAVYRLCNMASELGETYHSTVCVVHFIEHLHCNIVLVWLPWNDVVPGGLERVDGALDRAEDRGMRQCL